MAELAFEYLALALEAVRGTAAITPTHYVTMMGNLKPNSEYYEPEESRGTLAEVHRVKRVREWGEWEGEGPADVDFLPVLFNMLVKAVTTPTTPGGGTLSRLWSFVPTMTADDLKTATIWWGDPNNQIMRGIYGFIDEMTITADASSTEGVTISVNGMSQFPTQVADPTLPAQTVGPLMAAINMQLWLDTASAIGTTEITSRVVSAEHTIPSGIEPKYIAVGPTGSKTYTRIGRGKRRITTKVVFELLDMAQYTLFETDADVKLRVRHNGPLIEGALYNYLEVDTYGKLQFADWGDLEGVNRTIEMEVNSIYDTTLGADFRVAVQNQRTTL